MKKYNDQEKQRIESVRDEIKFLSNTASTKYDELCRELGLTEDTDEWLWDYVYNLDANSNEEYRELVERKLYGDSEK